ncbi:MAG: hypothetical protein KC563_15675, partial [Nitrospira sp.]|nr:hypothetical protein [Nitrospira sp.]
PIAKPDFVQDPQKSLVILFGDSQLLNTPERLQAVCHPFSGLPVVGCSTSGEVFGREIRDHSLVGAILQFEWTTVRTATASISDAAESFSVGQQLAHTLLHPDLAGILIFSDGLRVNGSELVRGMNALLPDSVIVTGGLAGDGDRFQHTWVLRDHTPQEGLISAVGLYGDRVRLGHGSKGGWDFFGPERRVTKS